MEIHVTSHPPSLGLERVTAVTCFRSVAPRRRATEVQERCARDRQQLSGVILWRSASLLGHDVEPERAYPLVQLRARVALGVFGSGR